MAIYRFEANGVLRKLNTDDATLLLSTRWEAGRDQTRWDEVYKTPKGSYVIVRRTLWQGEADRVFLLGEEEVVQRLALAEERQRTDAGDAMLASLDPSEDV